MNNKLKNSIPISKKNVQQKGGVVILSLKEYKKLSEKAIPTYDLFGREAEKADKMVEEGLGEYREGKTTKIKSLADLD